MHLTDGVHLVLPVHLALRDNMLTGTIPTELGLCQDLGEFVPKLHS